MLYLHVSICIIYVGVFLFPCSCHENMIQFIHILIITWYTMKISARVAGDSWQTFDAHPKTGGYGQVNRQAWRYQPAHPSSILANVAWLNHDFPEFKLQLCWFTYHSSWFIPFVSSKTVTLQETQQFWLSIPSVIYTKHIDLHTKHITYTRVYYLHSYRLMQLMK